jgi:hypothetical protein
MLLIMPCILRETCANVYTVPTSVTTNTAFSAFLAIDYLVLIKILNNTNLDIYCTLYSLISCYLVWFFYKFLHGWALREKSKSEWRDSKIPFYPT